MSWIDDLLNVINFENIYPKGKKTGVNQIIVNCPFHDDKHASMSINLMTGVYYCHTCSEKGNFLTWAKAQNLDLKQLATKHGIKFEEKTIEQKDVDDTHADLMKAEISKNWLLRNRGLTVKTIEKYKIGMYKKHFTIPIYDINGNLVNIRMYNPSGEGQAKMLSWRSGFGSTRLFPIENLYKDPIMLCEGEMDCILANQLGYNAITGTTGAKTFPREWARYFSGKKVMICYDVDEAGIAGSQRIAKILKDTAKAIKVVELPIDPKEISGGDFTDYIVKLGNTKKLLDTIIRGMPTFKSESDDDDKYHDVNLDKASHSKYNNKFIRTSALISGKDVETYLIPKKLKVTCTMNASKAMCGSCPMNFDDGELEIEIQKTDENIITLCGITKNEKQRVLKQMIGVPARCEILQIEEINSYNVEEIVLTTEIEYTTNIEKDESFVTRTSHFIGHDIKTNRTYDLEAKTIADPKTQKATHLIFNAKPSLTSLEMFNLSDEKIKRLQKFRDKDIYDKIEDIYDSTIQYVTGLRGREDLFTVALLTFCSPISYNFEGSLMKKGYIESLILGDTRTGKTDMIKSLIEYFRLGELVLGESATFAGLIGGLQQMGSRWHLIWGRIPLNNKRLVAIDEMSGLSIYEIAKLSGIRSSGIAEITKIRTERTWARTRLIWMSNPRGTKEDTRRMLSGYSQGIRAVPELIGGKEDISRFDLILLLGINDIPLNVINKQVKRPKTYEYTHQDFNDLVMFAWTLKPDQIKFTQPAIDKIYELSSVLSEKYDDSIPLVVGTAQRIKVAKLAVAAAAMNFNYDGEYLQIEIRHVDFVFDFLNKIFDKPICSYNEYSRLEKSRHMMTNITKIKEIVNSVEGVSDQLLDLDQLSQTDLQEIFEIDDRKEVRKLINTFIRNKALKRTSSHYQKTPAFRDFLREHKNGKYQVEDKDQVEEKTNYQQADLDIEDEEFPF